MNDDDLDNEITARVEADLAERAQRRERMRRVRAQFDRRRRHGKAKAHAQKLSRGVGVNPYPGGQDEVGSGG